MEYQNKRVAQKNKEYINTLFILGKLRSNEKLDDQLKVIYESDIDIRFLLKRYKDKKDIALIIQIASILLLVYKCNKKEQEKILKLLGEYIDKIEKDLEVVLNNKILPRAFRLDAKASIEKELSLGLEH